MHKDMPLRDLRDIHDGNVPILGFVYNLEKAPGAWYLVYPGQNHNVREILRTLIGCLEDWK